MKYTHVRKYNYICLVFPGFSRSADNSIKHRIQRMMLVNKKYSMHLLDFTVGK